MTLTKAIRFYGTGTPEVMRYEDVEVGDPKAGEVRLRHVAVGLNYADTYFVMEPIKFQCLMAWASKLQVSLKL